MEVSTVETNTTVKGHDSSNGDVFGDKKKRKCCSRRLVIVSATIGLLCIAGIAVGIYFAAADDSNTNDGTRANPTGSNHTGSEYTDFAEDHPKSLASDLENDQESPSDRVYDLMINVGLQKEEEQKEQESTIIAADDSNTNDEPRANPTGSNPTVSEYTDFPEDHPKSLALDLENDQESRSDQVYELFIHPGLQKEQEQKEQESTTIGYLQGCHIEQRNTFYINGICYHIFTDNSTEGVIENTCFLSGAEVVPMDKFEILGFYQTLFQDFRTCCLYQYNRSYEWPREVERNLSSLELTLNYTADIMRYKTEVFRADFDSTSVKCRAGWDLFYSNWAALNCSHRPDYSHVCIHVTTDTTDTENSDDFYGLNENHDAQDVQYDI